MSKADTNKKITKTSANKKGHERISIMHNSLQKLGSPLFLEKEKCTVVEREQEWQTQGSKVSDKHLDIFKQCVIDVLKELDPKFELSSDKRFAAIIYDKVLKHPPELRKGLAETLALLGTQPEALENCSDSKAEAIAAISIREILKDSDWILWGSLNNLLPTLAEAAPGEFLTAVENALNKTPCPFDELFSQQGDGITGGNCMTGLFWALEALAWDEEYLKQVTVILGKLASHDPRGNSGNCPANSLSTIFLPWRPQTLASVAKRKIAVETLDKKLPEVAWKLLLSLLNNKHQISSGSYKPVWRKIIPDDWEKGVTNKEYYDQVSIYAEIAVETAKSDFDKLNEIVDDLDDLPESSFDKFLEYLTSTEINNSPEEQRSSLWAALEKFTIKHRVYSDTDWALSPELVEKIEKVAKTLAPQKPQNLYRRLFDEGAMELYEEKGDWQEQERMLGISRQDAIQKIIAEGGLDAVLQFVETVSFPQDVGTSLDIVATEDMDTVILPDLLETENEKINSLVHGFIWSRQYTKEWKWVESIDTSGWSKTQIVKFLTHLPFKIETWQLAEHLLGESEIEYWNTANVSPYQAEDNLGLAIDKLIEYNRPHAAIYCLRRMLHKEKSLDKEQAIKALLASTSSTEPVHQMHLHDTTEIIKVLQDDPEVNQDKLLSIEWAYLALLTSHRKGISPKILERKLASEPDSFCEAIRLLYRSKDETETKSEPTEQQKMMAVNAGRLLRNWRIVPGTHRDGSFSGDDFNNWLDSVRTKTEESGHLEVALSTIGKVLIHYVPDPNDLWIHETLAEALNAEGADAMRDGFYVGIYNARGAHFVDPTGKPEKKLAADYGQQAEGLENAGYPRFADTIRNLATSYERQAEQIVEEHKGRQQEVDEEG